MFLSHHVLHSLKFNFRSSKLLLQARQSTFQRSLTVLSRVKSILCESGQVPRGMFRQNGLLFAFE